MAGESRIQNVKTPYFTVDEQAAGDVGNPDAGHQRLFIDSADNELKRKDSSGTVTPIEGGGAGSDTTAIHDNVSGEISVITEKTTLHNDDLFLIEDSEASNAKKRVKKSNLGAGGGSAWTQVVDENGASFANFTGASGTWSSDGTVIKQTDTAASFRVARYNNLIVTGLCIFQADIQIKSSGADRIGGIVVGFDGVNTAGAAARLNEGGDKIQIESMNATAKKDITATINIDTWYTLRVVVSGGTLTVYLDGTLMGSGGNNTQASNDAGYIGLYTYQAEIWFRNIKAWNLTLPA